jgi:hypothetical protein
VPKSPPSYSCTVFLDPAMVVGQVELGTVGVALLCPALSLTKRIHYLLTYILWYFLAVNESGWCN